MKLGILTCMYQRHDVFRVYAEGMKRLIKNFGVISLVVGSEGRVSKDLCGQYGLNYMECANQPLGRKHNYGMMRMRTLKPDYVMILGSDDLVNDALIKNFLEHMKAGYDIIGKLDTYHYDIQGKRLGYWPGYTNHRRGEMTGLCRTLSKGLLNRMGWHPWDGGARVGLDWTMTQKIKRFRPKIRALKIGKTDMFAVDLKGRKNITSFNAKSKTLVSVEKMKTLPEYEMILNLC